MSMFNKTQLYVVVVDVFFGSTIKYSFKPLVNLVVRFVCLSSWIWLNFDRLREIRRRMNKKKQHKQIHVHSHWVYQHLANPYIANCQHSIMLYTCDYKCPVRLSLFLISPSSTHLHQFHFTKSSDSWYRIICFVSHSLSLSPSLSLFLFLTLCVYKEKDKMSKSAEKFTWNGASQKH